MKPHNQHHSITAEGGPTGGKWGEREGTNSRTRMTTWKFPTTPRLHMSIHHTIYKQETSHGIITTIADFIWKTPRMAWGASAIQASVQLSAGGQILRDAGEAEGG